MVSDEGKTSIQVTVNREDAGCGKGKKPLKFNVTAKVTEADKKYILVI